MSKWEFIEQYHQAQLNNFQVVIQQIFFLLILKISYYKYFVDFAQDFRGTFIYSLQIRDPLCFYFVNSS
jgi:hypothetical protein